MAKDPATLWYWNDWQGGTITFTRHLKGCYMDLLHAQFNTGHLDLQAIKTVLGNDFASWGALSKKFVQDENGLFYNARLDAEMNKRRAYSLSRGSNRVKGLKAQRSNQPPVQDAASSTLNTEATENEATGNSETKTLTLAEKKALLEQRALDFKLKFIEFKDAYPRQMLADFYNYWTEPNKSFTRLRFELNKTWDLKRRLDYWANNSKTFNPKNTAHAPLSHTRKGQPDIDDAIATARKILADAAGNTHNG